MLTTISIILGIRNLNRPSPNLPLPAPTAPPASPAPSQPLQPDEAFRQAINTAGNAALLTQSAQTVQDWQQIATEWERAIALLQTPFPRLHP
ncbi:MAG: hypothetical protein HC833_24535, partial [Leptolyngbyaceae cyanobacterium RM1_406_9]|nr:hypothetical protein [Leptolyngbyaceae cyanobacterium RM1_406_9]